jgi:hypothetical protein
MATVSVGDVDNGSNDPDSGDSIRDHSTLRRW